MADEFTDGVTAPKKSDTDDNSTEDVTAFLAERVGEGKQYETLELAVAALAKKAIHADKHIETILSEKREVEEKYQTAVTQNKGIEDVLAAINAAGNEVPPATETEKPLTLETILAAVNIDQTEKSVATDRKNLIDATWKLLAGADAFGTLEAAQTAVTKYINNDPKRQAVVNAMAVADAKGLFALIKDGSQAIQFTEDYEGIHIEGVPDGKLTLAIIKDVREKHPEIYRSKAFQNRIHTEL